MFRKTSIKLAAVYLTIMMAISLFFSATIYQLSIQELDRGLRRPDSGIIQLGPGRLMPDVRELIEQERRERFDEAQRRVLYRLILINLLILVGGGYLSYLLALWTLKPIEEAHDSLERFTADASHELRTPIAAMQSETEVALMNPRLTLSQAKERLLSNLEELAKLTALSEGLLRLAQLNSHDLVKEVLSASDVVSAAMSRVLPQAEQKNILINSEVLEDIQLSADKAGIIEVIVIILDNAIKYSPSKSEVVVSAKSIGKHTQLMVTDQGIGIKATEINHIFDRFYRADSARSKQDVSGYGIGLAIAKNIMAMHQGSISVTSKPGKGSTFTIALPN